MTSPQDLKRIAQGPGRLDLAGAPEGYDALVMADIARARGGLSAFVARDGARASAFIDALRFFAPEIETIVFPAWDCLPYDRMGPSAGVAAQRMAALAQLTRAVRPRTKTRSRARRSDSWTRQEYCVPRLRHDHESHRTHDNSIALQRVALDRWGRIMRHS